MYKMTSFVKATLLSLGLSLAAQGNATVITFDDLPGGINVGSHYAGLSWTNLYTQQGNISPGGYANAVVSGQNATFNAGANDAVVSSSLFDFNGVYLTAAWNDGLNITVTGSQNGQDLYSQTVVVDTSGPTWFSFNFFGIDTLRFDSFGGIANAVFASSGAGEHFSMDNFTYNEVVQSVPESSSLALLALGLLGLLGARRAKH